MNKKEMTIVALLFALLIGWGFFQSKYLAPAPSATSAASSTNQVETVASGGGNQVRAAGGVSNPVPAAVAAPAVVATAVHTVGEQKIVISNGMASATVSSWGGCITELSLTGYRKTLDETSGPVTFDFSTQPALCLQDTAELGIHADFVLEPSVDGRSVVAVARQTNGLEFRRTIRIGEDYLFHVNDTFSNGTSSALTVPAHAVATGPMTNMEAVPPAAGAAFLGLDTLAAAGSEDVTCWSSRFPSFFGMKTGVFSCMSQQPQTYADQVKHPVDTPTAWVAAKNKFFVQVLRPTEPSETGDLYLERDTAIKGGAVVRSVSARLNFVPRVVEPGATWVREISYYAGPKDYQILKGLSYHQKKVMEFGKWTGWLCPPMLNTLNFIHKYIRSYGVAIILLTVLVRVILWPITHKSTESMKRMQAIQPQLKALREKFKDNPTKLNEQTMMLFKEHKVNPMGGCLPLVVQIPVFFALFTVLRSAIELRFASFLWAADLSAPEALFANISWIKTVTFGNGLNIWPLLMTATMAVQQQLTPSTGDPQQQRMMKWMSVAMLFFFYTMPSGLVLYWTVSQCISIAQLLMQRWRSKHGGHVIAVRG